MSAIFTKYLKFGPAIETNLLSSSVMAVEPVSVENTIHTKVQNLISGLAAKGIVVVEWGPLLLRRNSVPVLYTVCCMSIMRLSSPNLTT